MILEGHLLVQGAGHYRVPQMLSNHYATQASWGLPCCGLGCVLGVRGGFLGCAGQCWILDLWIPTALVADMGQQYSLIACGQPVLSWGQACL